MIVERTYIWSVPLHHFEEINGAPDHFKLAIDLFLQARVRQMIFLCSSI